MAVATSDFYNRVEAIVNPKKTTNGLYVNDISAFWVPGIGLKCGQVLRLLRKTYAKSAVPVFEWKRENNVREKFQRVSKFSCTPKRATESGYCRKLLK